MRVTITCSQPRIRKWPYCCEVSIRNELDSARIECIVRMYILLPYNKDFIGLSGVCEVNVFNFEQYLIPNGWSLALLFSRSYL